MHPYTLRREIAFLPPSLLSSNDPAEYGNLPDELYRFFAATLSSQTIPDVAAQTRNAYMREASRKPVGSLAKR